MGLGKLPGVSSDFTDAGSAPGAGFRPLFLVFPNLSGAVRDDADGGAVQAHEVSHLSEPALVNANGLVNLLVGKEFRTG